MTAHKTGTREEWLAARLELLEAEKALTRRGDELARWRQELPWGRIGKEYRFETGQGTAALAALVAGRGRARPLRRPPGESRRHALRGVAGSAGETAGVPAADGLELPLGVVVRQRLQLRLPGGAHQGAVAVGSRRVQLPRDGRAAAGGRRGESNARRDRGDRWNGLADVQARRARRERVRARGWRRIPHLLGVRTPACRPLWHVPVARPRATRSQRDRLLVEAPRRVRQPVKPWRGH